MAGDWIKMRSDLQTHPKVVRIMSALRADKLRVIGGLHAVWCLFDAHSEDGQLDGYTPEALDAMIGWEGFTDALEAVSWLEVEDGFLSLPRFDEHNGKSAKRRATETQRKREERAQPVRNLSASDADKLRSREEKRRSNTPLPPTGGEPAAPEASPGFIRFWDSWPKSPRKGGKSKCLAIWRRAKLEAEADSIVAHVLALRALPDWTKQNGEFIPAPEVYLNGRRWDGAELGTQRANVPWEGAL